MIRARDEPFAKAWAKHHGMDSGMKNLLEAQDSDDVCGDWEIPGTDLFLRIQPGMQLGRWIIMRSHPSVGVSVIDLRLTDQIQGEFGGNCMSSATAHRIARRIQELERT